MFKNITVDIWGHIWETFRSGLRCSSIFMSLTYSFDSLPPEQESESSGQYLSLLRLCPLDSRGWMLYSMLEKGHMSANVWGRRWLGRRWRDRYREIQRVICPSPHLWEPGIIVCMTGPQPPVGVIYMKPSLLAISTQGTNETAASQPDSQTMMKAARTHLWLSRGRREK